MTPNLPTAIAAGIYSVAPQIGKPALAWSALSPAQQKPFIKAANFLADYAFGTSLTALDRDKAAAALEAVAIPGLEDVNANVVVALAINIATTF